MTRTGLAIRILILAALMVVAAVMSAWVAFTFLTRGGEVTVPHLEGLELSAALELTSRDQLGLQVAGTGYDAGTPPGHVISQDPAAGTRIKEHRIVYVTVSQGTATVFVPDLSKLSLRKAQLRLAEDGLTLGKVAYTHEKDTPQGSVVAQAPPAGLFVPRNSGINLLLSDGPRPAVYVLPDLTGLPMESVLAQIRQLNLRSGRIAETEDAGLPPGTVTEMKPVPGSAVGEGQSVHLTVSRMPARSRSSEVVLFRHTFPFGLLEKNLRLALKTEDEERTVWEGTVQPGSSVSIPVVVSTMGTLRAYIDGELVEEKKVP